MLGRARRSRRPRAKRPVECDDEKRSIAPSHAASFLAHRVGFARRGAARVVLVLATAAGAQGVEGRRYSPGAFDTARDQRVGDDQARPGQRGQRLRRRRRRRQGAVRLDVDEGVLRVRPSGAWKFWRSKQLVITVTAREPKRIEISGAADVVAAEPLTLKQFQVRISGAGSVRLDKIKADQLEVSIAGVGSAQVAGRPRPSGCESPAAAPTSARTWRASGRRCR